LRPGSVAPLADLAREEGLRAFVFLSRDVTEQRRRLGIAQMLLAQLAEKRFEDLSNEVTGSGTLRIEDHRLSRTDTDYRLLNGQDRPICRLNIKFHGTLFREARRYVGLDPEDCFALATYKINNAVRRQEGEHLPYIFLVFSLRDASAADVGSLVPDDDVWALAVFQGKLELEEAIVARLLSPGRIARFGQMLERMPEGQFRVISAKKADRLFRENLFERVHALSFKGFTRTFRNAEVDMHFSLSRELTPVRTFLEHLASESPQKFAVRLFVGDY
jgi:hypothetical protein